MTEKRASKAGRKPIDRDLLHAFLWKKVDRRGFLPMTQKELADMLGLHEVTVSNILKELREDGKVKKVGKRLRVLDPSLTAWESGGGET